MSFNYMVMLVMLVMMFNIVLLAMGIMDDECKSSKKMTVADFLQSYAGNECVSIKIYCEKEYYDFFGLVDEKEVSDDNLNHDKPTYITKEPWWNEVKNRKIKEWNIIDGGMHNVELRIDLEKE